MVVKKPRIVIIGAGMAGLVAANKLYTCARSKELFEVSIVEGGSRIGGRINTWEFGGDQIELGATWIHGIGGSPIHRIAEEIGALESEQPWEHRDGYPNSNELLPIMEGGYRIDPCIVETISKLYRKMMEFAQGELEEDEDIDYYKLAAKVYKICTSNGYSGELGLGSFLRKCLDGYWVSRKDDKNNNVYCNLSRKLLEEAVFEIHENAERAHTSATDLSNLDYNAESEYLEFPEEEITIAKGYLSIIKHLASVLPAGFIQLGRKVRKIEWKSEGTTTTSTTTTTASQMVNGNGSSSSSSRPVKLHFEDGSILFADHVIITVSLGVLKAGIREESGMFSPPLPSFKIDAISRLGFGIVNKLFVQLNTTHDQEELNNNYQRFPYLQMGFHRSDSELRNQKIPWWMRRTDSLCPIYKNSSVLLSWFTGKEALKLESLNDEEIINGVSTTISSFLLNSQTRTRANSHQCVSNGNGKSMENSSSSEFKFTKIINSRWGTDPLFLGSYSYVAVGSSGDDLDIMAEPLPRTREDHEVAEFYPPPLQILFAGEATHRRQYSTTHGAYFSGEREALRLLKHYKCDGF